MRLFLKNTYLVLILLLTPFFTSISAAEVSPMVKINKSKAEEICVNFDTILWNAFSGWPECRQQILGMTLQADLVDWLIRARELGADADDIRKIFKDSNGATYDSAAFDYLTSIPRYLTFYQIPNLLIAMKNAKFDVEAIKIILTKRPGIPVVAEDLMKIMRDGKYDTDALNFLIDQNLVTSIMLSDLLIRMKNGKFDLDLIKLCNSTSMLNPISSARILNQRAILNCIEMFKDVDGKFTVLAKIAPCRISQDLVERNVCMAPIIKKIKN